MTYQKMLNHKVLSADEELQLLKDAQAGSQEARDQLILANLGLCHKICRQHLAKVHPDELMSDAIEGVNRAIDKFDTTSGFRFSSYAHKAIDQTVKRSAFLEPTIRIPERPAFVMRKYYKARQALRDETGTEPTWEQIAARTNETVAELKRCVKFVEETSVETHEIPMHAFMDNFERETATRDEVETILSFLPEQSQALVRQRFMQELTLRQIAALQNKSAEWVRLSLKIVQDRLIGFREALEIDDATEREAKIKNLQKASLRPFSDQHRFR